MMSQKVVGLGTQNAQEIGDGWAGEKSGTARLCGLDPTFGDSP